MDDIHHDGNFIVKGSFRHNKNLPDSLSAYVLNVANFLNTKQGRINHDSYVFEDDSFKVVDLEGYSMKEHFYILRVDTLDIKAFVKGMGTKRMETVARLEKQSANHPSDAPFHHYTIQFNNSILTSEELVNLGFDFSEHANRQSEFDFNCGPKRIEQAQLKKPGALEYFKSSVPYAITIANELNRNLNPSILHFEDFFEITNPLSCEKKYLNDTTSFQATDVVKVSKDANSLVARVTMEIDDGISEKVSPPRVFFEYNLEHLNSDFVSKAIGQRICGYCTGSFKQLL